MARLRFGFKAEANWWSRELRREQGIPPEAPMSIHALSDHLDIDLMRLTDLKAAAPAACAHFRTELGRREFSAVTLMVGGRRTILFNDSSDRSRQSSDIAHEIAHAVLQHPVPALFQADGRRNHNPAHEEEAAWLGPALLISDEAAVFIFIQGLSLNDAATIYGCSREVVQMRINVSGARKRVA